MIWEDDRYVKRRDARELVIKTLFACDMEKGDPLRQLAYIAADQEMSGFTGENQEDGQSAAGDAFALRLLAGISANKAELDHIIADYAVDWEISRLGGAERNILRLGLYEMLYDEKLPPAVAINEAVDLVKKYGSPESAGFVNGILDNVDLKTDDFILNYRNKEPDGKARDIEEKLTGI